MSEENNLVEMVGGGIICDNENCDFEDDTVKVSEYPEWLNKPCPKCGENLLTQEDYDNMELVRGIVMGMNNLGKNALSDLGKIAGDHNASFKIKSTKGKITMSDIKIEDDGESS